MFPIFFCKSPKKRSFGTLDTPKTNKPLVPLQFDLPLVGQKEWGLKGKENMELLRRNTWKHVNFGNNMDKCKVRTGRHKAKELSLAPKFLELPQFEVLTCVVQFLLCKRTSSTNSNFLLQIFFERTYHCSMFDSSKIKSLDKFGF